MNFNSNFNSRSGDPDDVSLRKVEKDVLIPKKMRDKAKTEKCIEEVAAFTECCKGSSIAMVIKCRVENTILRDCLGLWYKNEEFIALCTKEYLKERSDYRKTGVRQSSKRMASSS